MTISRISCAALLAVVVSACDLLPGAAPAVAGREFLSTSVTVGGLGRPPVEGTRIRLGFSTDGMISASAGCNEFSGLYRIDGGVLVVTDEAMTEMACEPALMEQDEWLFALLGSGPRISSDGDELILEEGDTVITLVDREVADPDLPLIGPVWAVTALVDGDTVSSVPSGVTATLVFTEEGLVMVDTGCNTGSGAVQILTSTLRFGAIAMTQMACAGEAGAMERAMREVLNADVVRYQIEGRLLELSIGGGGLQLAGTL